MSHKVKNEAWDFEDEDKTYELVEEIRDCLYEAYYTFAIGDEFSKGVEYVVKNMEDIQRLDRASQVELVRMGYEKLAEDMGYFSHALRAIAERGSTSFYGPAIGE